MPRAPFNTTIDVYSGPSAVPPNTYKRTVNARIVVDDRKILLRPLAFGTVLYITCDGPLLSAGTAVAGAGTLTWNWGLADVVETPSGSGIFRRVVRCEVRIPRPGSGTTYNRLYVQ